MADFKTFEKDGKKFLQYDKFPLPYEIIDDLLYSEDHKICHGLSPLIEEIPEHLIIKDGVCEIADYAFCDNTGIKDIFLSDTVERIGKQAFYRSSVRYINLDKVRFFGEDAFAASNLSGEIVINKNAKFGTKEKKLDNYTFCTFASCKNLESVKFGPSVVPRSAFDNSGFSSFEFMNDVTEICPYAFHDCKNLKHITLKEGLMKIGMCAFEGSGLNEITIPSTVYSIEPYAFATCRALTQVKFLPPTGEIIPPLMIKNNSFANTAIYEFTVPPHCITIGQEMLFSCLNLEAVTIDARVSIPEAFAKKCTNLKHVVLNENIVNIGIEAFAFTGLTEVNKNFKNIKNFGPNAFLGCDKLTFIHTYGEANFSSMYPFQNCEHVELVILENKEKVNYEAIGLMVPDSYKNEKNITLLLPCMDKSKISKEFKNFNLLDISSGDAIIKLTNYMSFNEIQKLFGRASASQGHEI